MVLTQSALLSFFSFLASFSAFSFVRFSSSSLILTHVGHWISVWSVIFLLSCKLFWAGQSTVLNFHSMLVASDEASHTLEFRLARSLSIACRAFDSYAGFGKGFQKYAVLTRTSIVINVQWLFWSSNGKIHQESSPSPLHKRATISVDKKAGSKTRMLLNGLNSGSRQPCSRPEATPRTLKIAAWYLRSWTRGAFLIFCSWSLATWFIYLSLRTCLSWFVCLNWFVC